MSESVVIDVQLNSPIGTVWNALTTSETMSSWMLFKSNTFKPELGHTFQLSGVEGYDQTVECEVTELDEPNKLAYTWLAVGVDGVANKTLVTFTLTETDEGTSLNLVQSGFRPEVKAESAGARYGWTSMLGELEKLLTT